MYKSTTAVVVCSLAAWLVLTTAAGAQNSAQPVVAMVREVGGGSVTVTPKAQPLEQSSPLYAGDIVTCATNAFIVFIDSEGASRRLGGDECAKAPFAYSNGKFAVALDRYGKLGGRPRGTITGLLIWPADEVRTLPETAATIEWRAQSRGNGTVTVRGQNGEVIWASDVDGAAGRLDNSDLSDSLRRHAAAGNAPITVQLRVSTGQSAEASVTLVGGEDRTRVEQRLMTMSGLPPDAAHVFRAEVYLEEGLRREALNEYIEALRLMPDAAFLLRKATNLAIELGDSRAPGLSRRTQTLN